MIAEMPPGDNFTRMKPLSEATLAQLNRDLEAEITKLSRARGISREQAERIQDAKFVAESDWFICMCLLEQCELAGLEYRLKGNRLIVTEKPLPFGVIDVWADARSQLRAQLALHEKKVRHFIKTDGKRPPQFLLTNEMIFQA